MRIYDLEPEFASCASFYGKAKVIENEDGETLLSYGTEVAVFNNGSLRLLPAAGTSQTTRRHVREYAAQRGYDVHWRDGKAVLSRL